MTLGIYLFENSSATHPDIISIKCEEIGYANKRSPSIYQLPSGTILGLDLGRIGQRFVLSAIIDEDLEELFIANASGTFTVGETIVGDSSWNAAVTPPRVYNVVVGCVTYDVPTYADYTVAANNVAVNDAPLLPVAPAVNDAIYLGSGSPTRGFRINVGQAGVKAPGTWTLAYEYSQGWGNWGILTGVTDNTTEFTVVGSNNIFFNIPINWVTDSVMGISACWVRLRASAATSPIGTQPKATQIWTFDTPAAVIVAQPSGENRLIISQLGHGNSDFFVNGETITGVTSGVTATVVRPLATYRRWEQIARSMYTSGNMTLSTPNGSYTVMLEDVSVERIAGQVGRYQGKIALSRVA